MSRGCNLFFEVSTCFMDPMQSRKTLIHEGLNSFYRRYSNTRTVLPSSKNYGIILIVFPSFFTFAQIFSNFFTPKNSLWISLKAMNVRVSANMYIKL